MPIQVEKKIDPREMDIGTGIYMDRAKLKQDGVLGRVYWFLWTVNL